MQAVGRFDPVYLWRRFQRQHQGTSSVLFIGRHCVLQYAVWDIDPAVAVDVLLRVLQALQVDDKRCFAENYSATAVVFVFLIED